MTFIKGHSARTPVPSISADICRAGSLLPESVMILFTQSTADIHKYLNDELKLLCLLQFFRVCTKFPDFSMFREIPEYSRFVARWLKMNDDGDVDGRRLISSQCGTWFLKEWGNERRLQCLTDEYLCVDDIRFTKGLQLFISSYTTTTNTSTNNLMQYWQQKVTSLLLTT